MCQNVPGHEPGLANLTEQAIYFAMGFLVALFAAVVAIPVFTRRALRLAKARTSIQTTRTEKDAAIGADALLAEHAVEVVRLTHRLAIAEDNFVRLRGVVGRQSIQIASLDADAKKREQAILDMRSELDKGLTRSRDLEVAVAASQVLLYDAFAQRDRALNLEVVGKDYLGKQEAEASRDRARIAMLIAQVENLRELLQYSEAAKEGGEKSIFNLTD